MNTRMSARDPRYRDYEFYLDGQDISGYATEVDLVEGWARCIVTDETRYLFESIDTSSHPHTGIRRGQISYVSALRTPEQEHEIAVITTIAELLYERAWSQQRKEMIALQANGILIAPNAPLFRKLPYEKQLTFIEQAYDVVCLVRVAEQAFKRAE